MPGYANWAAYVRGIRSRRSTRKIHRKKSRKHFSKKPFACITGVTRGFLKPNYNLGFWPNTCTKTMRYCEQGVNLTGSIAGVFGTETLFSLVNPSHVYNGVSTHAVYGWSEAKNMYHQYKVLGVQVRVTVTGNDNKDDVLLVAFQSSLDTWTYSGTSTKYASEKPGNVCLMANNSTSGGSGGGPMTQPSFVEKYISIPQIEGITPAQHKADINLYCGLTANTSGPARYPTMCLAVGSASGSNSSTMTANVELVYVIKFWDRITQTYTA